MALAVKFAPHTKGKPVDKVADAELHFLDGPLKGYRLLGFAVWKKVDHFTCTFPMRPYGVHGHDRKQELLRLMGDTGDGLREFIVREYLKFLSTASLTTQLDKR